MAVMDVEFNPPSPQNCTEGDTNSISITVIINDLINNSAIYFKNQQRDENDLDNQEKQKLATELFEKSKVNFLTRFGKYLKHEHLEYFKQFEDDSETGYEISVILKDLLKISTEKGHRVNVKNRRYEALKELIEGNSYFTETEMMKRNPLLYDQLVGKYMTEAEKKERDKMSAKNMTFVRILMEGIERDESEKKRMEQASLEEDAAEESEKEKSKHNIDLSRPSSSSWGEIREEPGPSMWGEIVEPNRKRKAPERLVHIAAKERNLLREEFITTMYQNFLDGKDDDFDYNDVDNNDKYDNIDILSKDEEEKYFDSEDPEDTPANGNQQNGDESSEDELDIYMNALNQHPSVLHLSEDMKKL